MDAHHHFATLARYNAWATQRLLDAVAALDDGDYRRDAGLFFKSIHGTLNHLLVGEHHVWFVRFAEGISPKVAVIMIGTNNASSNSPEEIAQFAREARGMGARQ